MKHLYNNPLKATIAFLTLITFFHSIIAHQIGLSVDEAAYTLYGQHLSLSYYDHPPMVGWLQALIIPFSKNNLAMRIWPMLFNIGTSIVLYRTTRQFFPDKNRWSGFIAVAVMQSAIVFQLLGFALIPQTSFLFFALLSLNLSYKIITTEKRIDFVYLGVCLGLAALSEYTAIILAIAIAVFILSAKPKLLLSLNIYLSAIIAIVIASPVFIWNVQNKFISFHYQTEHVVSHGAWSFLQFIESQLGQIIAYSPSIYVLGLLAVIAAIKQYKDRAQRLLALCFIIVIIFFAANSGKTFTLPHWPALAWICLCPLISIYLLQNWHKLWIRILVVFAIVYSTVFFVFLQVIINLAYPNFPLGKNPLQDLYHVDTMAQHGKQLLQKEFPKGTGHLFVPNWTAASRIAWYAQAPVLLTHHNAMAQTVLWYGKPKQNDQGIVIVQYDSAPPKQQGTQAGDFKHCTLIDTKINMKYHRQINRFDFYRCTGYIA
jgi:4-amino-4-deoxy-L-arabinose transferase-like glycosyltransferase